MILKNIVVGSAIGWSFAAGEVPVQVQDINVGKSGEKVMSHPRKRVAVQVAVVGDEP